MKNFISIILCLCLILSACSFIFATNYEYTSYQAFVTGANAGIPLNTVTTYTSVLFLSDFPSEFQSLYNSVINNYNLDASKIYLIQFNKSSTYRSLSIGTASNTVNYSYPYRLGTDAYTPVIYSYFNPNTQVGLYRAAQNLSTSSISYYTPTLSTSTMNTVSAYPNNNMNAYGTFAGFYVTASTFSISPTSSYQDYYILNVQDSGGGGGSDEYDGLPYDTFVNPAVPSDMNNISASSVPYSYQVYQDLLNSPSYDPTDAWQPFRVMLGTFPTMWEYYQRWFYGNHFKYMDDILTAMEGLSTMSDNIQLLTDVYASPEEVEAREFAAENQQAVVDNFIDPDGSGAASVSDFETISDLSDGFKNTFSSDADPVGIFDLFNSTNLGWFSQETLNQLDTSNNTRKSGSNVDTPLLDQQIEEIYSRLGVKYAH